MCAVDTGFVGRGIVGLVELVELVELVDLVELVELVDLVDLVGMFDSLGVGSRILLSSELVDLLQIPLFVGN